MNTALSFFVSFGISTAFTKAMILLSAKKGWFVRNPSEDRWHKKATPSMGGIAIYVGFFVSCVLFSTFVASWKVILLGSTIIFLAGLVDDIFALPAYLKLAIQLTLSALMVFLHFHALLSWNPFIYILLTILWIVFMTNAFNLIDNMDGLASGIALISIVFMVLSDRIFDARLPLPIIAGLAGSILGFFVFNKSPAKIFMGDCGSQLIGFTLACFSILDTWQGASHTALMLVAPILVFAVPIFDTTLVTILRKFYGRPISQGGKDHTSHRLVNLGFSEKKTVAILWLIACVFGSLAVLTKLLDMSTWGVILGGLIAFSLVCGIFLADAGKEAPIATGRKFFPINLFFQRRLVEVFTDTLAILLSYIISYLLRYDWLLDPYVTKQLIQTLPLVLAVKLTVFLGLGLYRGFWNYIDFESMTKTIKICFLSSVASISSIIFLYRFQGFSRTLFAIDFALLLIFILGTRALLRWTRESFFAYPQNGVRIAVLGVSMQYKPLLNEIRKNRQWNLLPVVCIDLHGKAGNQKLLDIPVCANLHDLDKTLEEKTVQHIVIAGQGMNQQEMNASLEMAKKSDLPYTVVESLERSLVSRVHGVAL